MSRVDQLLNMARARPGSTIFFNAAGDSALAGELEAESKKPNTAVRCMPGRQFAISVPEAGSPLEEAIKAGDAAAVRVALAGLAASMGERRGRSMIAYPSLRH